MWHSLDWILFKRTVECAAKLVERIVRTSNKKHEHRFAASRTTAEFLVADVHKAVAYLPKLRKDAEQSDAAKTAERVQKSNREEC